MTDAPQTPTWPGRVFPLAAFLIVLLAVGAVVWPRGRSGAGQGWLVVYDTSGQSERLMEFYQPLADYLAEIAGGDLDVVLAPTVGEFLERAADGAEFVLCPDGLGLSLTPEVFAPLVIVRRAVPYNLRPRSVMVYRKSAGPVTAPWRKMPQRTVFGDSVSLTATARLRALRPGPTGEAASPADRLALHGCAWGPDPYDHAAVLHAARLGAFDFAIVRQWDADRFFKEELLSPLEWGREVLSTPLPDIVLLCRARRTPAQRLKIRQALASLGRAEHPPGENGDKLLAGLDRLHLAGFNLLLEPEVASARSHFAGDWPPADK